MSHSEPISPVPDLGRAASFAVFGGAGLTNHGLDTGIIGDAGSLVADLIAGIHDASAPYRETEEDR